VQLEDVPAAQLPTEELQVNDSVATDEIDTWVVVEEQVLSNKPAKVLQSAKELE